jgi:hypothetical protein
LGQISAAAHTVPHIPQLEVSALVSTQVPLQQVKRKQQSELLVQLLPGRTQHVLPFHASPEQQSEGSEPVPAELQHVPLEQPCPPGQTVPQPLQWLASVVRLVPQGWRESQVAYPLAQV